MVCVFSLAGLHGLWKGEEWRSASGSNPDLAALTSLVSFLLSEGSCQVYAWGKVFPNSSGNNLSGIGAVICFDSPCSGIRLMPVRKKTPDGGPAFREMLF